MMKNADLALKISKVPLTLQKASLSRSVFRIGMYTAVWEHICLCLYHFSLCRLSFRHENINRHVGEVFPDDLDSPQILNDKVRAK